MRLRKDLIAQVSVLYGNIGHSWPCPFCGIMESCDFVNEQIVPQIDTLEVTWRCNECSNCCIITEYVPGGRIENVERVRHADA